MPFIDVKNYDGTALVTAVKENISTGGLHLVWNALESFSTFMPRSSSLSVY